MSSNQTPIVQSHKYIRIISSKATKNIVKYWVILIDTIKQSARKENGEDVKKERCIYR